MERFLRTRVKKILETRTREMSSRHCFHASHSGDASATERIRDSRKLDFVDLSSFRRNEISWFIFHKSVKVRSRDTISAPLFSKCIAVWLATGSLQPGALPFPSPMIAQQPSTGSRRPAGLQRRLDCDPRSREKKYRE